MSDNPQEPREYDAVLGGDNPPPVDGAVLGGIEGVKRRFASKVVKARVAALRDALNYGDAGLDLVIKALQDESILVKSAAIKLLRVRSAAIRLLNIKTERKVQLALLLYSIPTNSEGYNKRGLQRQKLGDLEGAIADFSRAIEIDDEYADAYLNRGICWQKLGDFQKAKINYLYLMLIKDDSVSPYYRSGFCSHELKQ